MDSWTRVEFSAGPMWEMWRWARSWLLLPLSLPMFLFTAFLRRRRWAVVVYPNLQTEDPFSLTFFARARFCLGAGVLWLLLLCVLAPSLAQTVWRIGRWFWGKLDQQTQGRLGRLINTWWGNILFGILVFIGFVPLVLSFIFVIISPPLWLSGELLAPLEAHRLGNAITGDRELKPRCLLFEDADHLIVFGVFPWRFFDPHRERRYGVARWSLSRETETMVIDDAPSCQAVGWSADRSAFWIMGADDGDRLVAFDRGAGQRAQWRLPPAPGRTVASAACLVGESWVAARALESDDKKTSVRLDSGGERGDRFTTLGDPGVFTGVALSSRCEWLAVSNTGGVQVYALEGFTWQETSAPLGEAPTGQQTPPMLTVKGAKQVFLTEAHLLRVDEGHLEVWALAEGRQVDALPASARLDGRIARSADGLIMAFTSGGHAVREVRSGRVIQRYPGGFNPIVLDPMGARLAGAAVGSIRVWNVPEAPGRQ